MPSKARSRSARASLLGLRPGLKWPKNVKPVLDTTDEIEQLKAGKAELWETLNSLWEVYPSELPRETCEQIDTVLIKHTTATDGGG